MVMRTKNSKLTRIPSHSTEEFPKITIDPDTIPEIHLEEGSEYVSGSVSE